MRDDPSASDPALWVGGLGEGVRVKKSIDGKIKSEYRVMQKIIYVSESPNPLWYAVSVHKHK